MASAIVGAQSCCARLESRPDLAGGVTLKESIAARVKKRKKGDFSEVKTWLPDMDSNHD